jgi:outer membrane protein insertion porin family
MRILIAALSMAILFVPPFAPSQDSSDPKSSTKGMPATAFKLISVQVKGANRYKPTQIVAASGLEIGQTVREEDFKAGVQRLGDSGAFTEVAYSFQYSAEGTKLELQIIENDQVVPVRFDNLVWFSDQEVLGKLQARVPLFLGQLPLSGNLTDQVSEALQGLLDERNVQGKVDYLRTARQGGPLEAIAFSVTGPKITIHNTEFPGAAPAELPLLQAAAKKLTEQDYLRSVLRVQEDQDFLPVYRSRGYLKATFGDAQANVVNDSPQQSVVDVKFPVEPGRQYKIEDVRWEGNSVFPGERLQPFLHLRAGQPVDAVQLGDDLEAAKKLYGTRGYLAVAIQPVPEFHDGASTVSYRLQVHEGDVYRMGELEIRGLDPRDTARLVDLWKLHEGDPFDDSYPKAFVEGAVKSLSLTGEWIVIPHQADNDSDKTVDVAMRFEVKK